jgi:TonB family protein
VLLGAWWLCYRLALRAERSFAYNRAFLGLGPLLAVGLPLLPLAWPAGWWGTGPAGLSGVAAVLLPAVQVGGPGATAAAAGHDWSFWLLVVYLSGAAFMLARLAYGLAGLWHTARRLPRTAHAGYLLAETHGRLPTSSFGRVVFWDETLPLSPAEARQVLAHERAHVRQYHTYDRLLLELLRSVLWFNPFVHLCARALVLTHEYLADAAALHDDSRLTPSHSTSYSQLLARQVASRLGFSVPLAHSFSHSQTLSRIAMIQKTNPISRWKQWLALPIMGLLLITVACEKAASQVASGSATNMPAPPPPIPVPNQNKQAAPPKVYTFVQHMPQMPGGGGNKAIVKAIQRTVIYPPTALANHIEGQVFVSFYVDSEGHVKEAKIVKGLDPAIDAAVIAAVQKLPRFTPGTQDGKAVTVIFTVPIEFVI